MRESNAADAGVEHVGSVREGLLKHLLFSEVGSPNNYDLNLGHTGDGCRIARHRHYVDQIRFEPTELPRMILHTFLDRHNAHQRTTTRVARWRPEAAKSNSIAGA